MNKIITEITPLEKKDCFYLVDRNKESFTFPLHKHEEIELNFVENCSGARRIVGDSIEILGQYDLALIGSNLEHVWEQNVCQHQKVREITIQFEPNLFGDTLLGKSQMNSIQQLLENAKNGIAFSLSAIMRIYTRLDEITKTQPGFYRVIKLLEILYELSNDTEYRKLASSSFANVQVSTESRRVRKVEEYIDTNFKQEVRLQTLADLAGMTSSAFSRFFKLRTGKTVQEYIIDVRIGHAARALVDSSMSIAEICIDCGFNNISNFNRIFKKKKGEASLSRKCSMKHYTMEIIFSKSKPLIIITFDDGRRNIFTTFPILQQNNFPFYVFVVGNFIGASEEFISEKEFDTIKNAGGILGWHTKSHKDLTTLSTIGIKRELKNKFSFSSCLS